MSPYVISLSHLFSCISAKHVQEITCFWIVVLWFSWSILSWKVEMLDLNLFAHRSDLYFLWMVPLIHLLGHPINRPTSKNQPSGYTFTTIRANSGLHFLNDNKSFKKTQIQSIHMVPESNTPSWHAICQVLGQ